MKKRETTMWSDVYEEQVAITKEKHDHVSAYCARCARPLKSFYVVRGLETGIEHACFGEECISHLW